MRPHSPSIRVSQCALRCPSLTSLNTMHITFPMNLITSRPLTSFCPLAHKNGDYVWQVDAVFFNLSEKFSICFSSSVKSLRIYWALTCDMFNSDVKNTLSSRYTDSITFRNFSHRFSSVAINNVPCCLGITEVFAGLSPNGKLSFHPSLNQSCHLYTTVLDTPMYLSVRCSFLKVCIGVFQTEHKTELLFYASFLLTLP